MMGKWGFMGQDRTMIVHSGHGYDCPCVLQIAKGKPMELTASVTILVRANGITVECYEMQTEPDVSTPMTQERKDLYKAESGHTYEFDIRSGDRAFTLTIDHLILAGDQQTTFSLMGWNVPVDGNAIAFSGSEPWHVKLVKAGAGSWG